MIGLTMTKDEIERGGTFTTKTGKVELSAMEAQTIVKMMVTLQMYIILYYSKV